MECGRAAAEGFSLKASAAARPRVAAGKDVVEVALDHPHRTDLAQETNAEPAETFGVVLRGIALCSVKPYHDVVVTSKPYLALSCQVKNILHCIIKYRVKRASRVGVFPLTLTIFKLLQ